MRPVGSLEKIIAPKTPTTPKDVRGPKTPEETPKKGTPITFYHIENGEKLELKGTVQGRRKNEHGVYELKVLYAYLGKKHTTWITARKSESVAATVLHMRPMRKKMPNLNATLIQRKFREWLRNLDMHDSHRAATRLQRSWRQR